MKRIIAAVFVCVVFLLSFLGCSSEQSYNADEFIGKTSSEIEAEFGAFDCCGRPSSADGLYRNTSCGYTIQEEKQGFLDKIPEWLVFISFDENGVACDTYEGYRPGG